jgi:glutathione S-transferase
MAVPPLVQTNDRGRQEREMYKVYSRPGTGAMVVEAVLEEIGAAYELITIKRDKQRRPPPDYLEINPLGQVPTLILADGRVMTESAAIAIYLADKNPEARLAPEPSSPLRPDFLRWLIFLATTVYTSDLRIYYAERYTLDPEGAEAVKQAAVAAVAREWSIFAAALGDRAFALGQTFSILDVYVAMLATWNVDVPAFFRRHPNVKALYDRVVSRPAVARVWERHQVSF